VQRVVGYGTQEHRSHLLGCAQIASPAEREAYLERACGGDVELRRRVEQLLEARSKADDFFQSPDATQASANGEPVFEREGAVIGPYRLMEQIGEGGMGLVFVAEQQQPVRRKVALKLIKPGMDTRQVIARFEAERQALAMMDHPNIAKVLDAGTTETGRPYFVMELVKGVPITAYCDQNQLTPHERLELFVTVCQAVQHAHQKGIIHRDIKPSNVLVTLHDDKPVVKVIDFGVAKAIGQQLTERTIYTAFAQMVGTPLYMSPEQAALSGVDVDTRSDLYSLGVLLYELLTGTTPFDESRLKEAAFDEVRRIICEEEPQKPSTRISSLGATLTSVSLQRRMEPHKLSQLVRGDLDWIVMKALEKDRGRRYETANALAADVLCYLNDEPVTACPPSRAYRIRKFARRNKALIGTIALVSAALVAGTAVSVWQAVRATIAERETATQRDVVTDAERRARENANQAKAQQGIAEQNEATAKANERAAKANELLARQRYYAAQMNLAARAWEEGDTPRVLELLESQRPRITEEDLRAFEWYALWQLCHSQLRYSRQEVAGLNYKLAFSPDSSLIALGGSDGTVKLIDAASGQDVRTLGGAWRSNTGAIAFSPDGQWLAQGTGNDEVTLWNVATGEPGLVLSGTGGAYTMEFSPGGDLLASSASDGVVKLWDTETGNLRETCHAPSVMALDFSPDGKTLATTSITSAGENKATYFWDLTVSPPRLAREIAPRGRSVAFSEDGRHFAVGTTGAFSLFDTQSWKEVPVRKGRWGDGWSLAFVPGRDVVAVGVDSRCVKLVDFKTGKATTLPHHSPLRSLAVASDGTLVAAIGTDAVLKVWNLGAPERPDAIATGAYITSLSLDPSARTLAVGAPRMVKLFDVDSGERKGDLQGHSLGVQALGFFQQGRMLAAGSASWNQPGELLVWDVERGVPREPVIDFPRAAYAVAVSPDERILAVGAPAGGLRGSLHLFDVATAKQREHLETPAVTALTYSHDGKLLISASQAIALRDPVTGVQRTEFGPKEVKDWIWSLACSADSRLLASGNKVGLVHLWELPSGRLRATLRGNTSSVRSVAFFPDGKTLATANDAGEVKLWDVATGQERITFRFGWRVTVGADGQLLVAGSSDGTVRLLRASTAPEALARKSELNPDDPDSPVTQNDGGDRLWAARQYQEAEAAYRQARQRLEVLLAQAPDVVEFRRELCRSGLSLKLLLDQQKKHAEAERVWQSVRPALRALPPEEQPALTQYVIAVAALIRQAGRADRANRLCLDAADTFARLPPEVAADPARRTIVNSLYGNVLGLLKGDEQSGEAERVYGKWIAALELLTVGRNDEPVAVADLKRLTQHCRQLVQQHAAAKDAQAALADYRPVADFYRRLIAEHPRDVDLFNDFDSLRQAVAMLLINNEAVEPGEKLLDESLYESLALASERPEHAQAHAGRLYNLGVARLNAKQPAAALEFFQQAFDLHVRLVEQSPADAARRDKFRRFRRDLRTAFRRFNAPERDDETPPQYMPFALGAVTVYEQLLAAEPRNVSLRLAYVELLREVAGLFYNANPRRGAEAEVVARKGLTVAEEAAKEFPQETAFPWWSADLMWAVGWSLRYQERHEESVEVFRGAVELRRRLGEQCGATPSQRLELNKVWSVLALALYSCGKREESLEARRAALAVAEALADEAPEDVARQRILNDSKRTVAAVAAELQHWDEAEEQLQKVEEFYQGRPDDKDRAANLAYVWYDRARICSLRGQMGEAITAYSRAIELEPDIAFIVHQRGVAFLNMGEFDQALSDFTRARELQPDNPWHLADGGYARVGLGQFAEAVADLSEAIRAREQNGKADAWMWRARGEAYVGLGEWELALADFSQALELEPGVSGRWYRAQYLMRLGQFGEARDYYLSVLEKMPDSASTLNNLAWLLATCEAPKFLDAPRAVELARKAVELAPTEGNNWNTLGVAQYRTGDWPAAVESLRKSDGLGGEAVLGFNAFFLAMAHWQLGHQDEARAWYDRAVEWTDLYLPYNEEVCRFQAEATELLGL
jgi:WD40 repeat protein/serine/threonine protein kinase/tetratricopeptide (TPR) repeat protein